MANRAAASRRMLSTVVAITVAAAGTFALAQYVGGLEADAAQGAELVEVFVADRLIPADASADAVVSAGMISKQEVLARSVPQGAVGSLRDLNGLVTLTDILPGEVLLMGRFGSQAAVVGAFDIPDGMHAMSVEVDVPLGVANVIEPGDRVSLIAHVEREERDEDADPSADTLGVSASSLDRVVVQPGVSVEFRGGWSQFILQNIEVLAIGQRVYDAEGDDEGLRATQGTVMMTLAVAPDQAERLAIAIFEADIYATLLPEGAPDVDTNGVTLADLFR